MIPLRKPKHLRGYSYLIVMTGRNTLDQSRFRFDNKADALQTFRQIDRTMYHATLFDVTTSDWKEILSTFA